MILEKIFSENYIHVIDDFYDDLDWVDEHVKSASFVFVPDVNFPGKNSYISEEANLKIHQRIETLLGTKLEYSPNNGEVRVAVSGDLSRTYVHIDNHFLILIIYLCDPPSGLSAEESGTSFYIHKLLKDCRFQEKGMGRKLVQTKAILRDTFNLEVWERWLSIPMKKNRALLYDGNLFHSGPAMAWGDSLENGRVTQHFFLKLAQA